MTEWVQATVIEVQAWTDNLFSLRFAADIAPFKAGQFVRVGMDIEGERVGRPYSLVNAPHEDVLEIHFNIVPEGPLSPRLAVLKPGDTFFVGRAASGFLTLDETPPAPEMWMLATGTAIGPFLSILKTAAPWERFERIVLGYSVRIGRDLAYEADIRALVERHGGQLRYVPLVTREDVEGALRERIPASIASGTLEARTGLALTPARSHVMLCGNAAMIADTIKVLEARALKRHRRREPGHISMEKYH